MDFPVSFVAVCKMLKYLRGPESTPGKDIKRSSVLRAQCWTTLTHLLLKTWDELKYITNLQKDKWRSVIIYSYWKLRGSLRVDAWQSRIWVLHWQLYNALKGNQFILVLLLCSCRGLKLAWDNLNIWPCLMAVYHYHHMALTCTLSFRWHFRAAIASRGYSS